jgi:CSLREA domain-containing protein
LGSAVHSGGFRRALRFAAIAGALLCAWPVADAAASTATFSWDRPPRYVDTNADGLPDPRNTTEEINAPFTVHVNACASTGGISEYQWRSPGSTPKNTPNCDTTLTFAQEGTFPLTLTVVSASGNSSATKNVIIKDLLIVSLGDSFASGEGNPHSFGLGNGLLPFPVNVKWQAEDDTGASRCHRSAYAGSALAAAWLEDHDPQTSVTFVQLACSGAKIEDQHLFGDLASGDAYYHEGGLLDPYRGVEPRAIGLTSEEPPQVDHAADITGSRSVDAMTISIGGNDLHFSSIIKDCLMGHASRLKNGDLRGCDVPSVPAPPDCGSQDGAGKCAGVDEYNQQLALLPGRFSRLAARLSSEFGSRLPASRVFMLEYPSQTRCDDGEVCPLFDPLISMRESKWADSVVLPGLNGAIKQAVQSKGWSYVGGVSARFETGGHGYAADDSWFVSLPRSFAQQAAKDGAFHPNRAGQRWYRNRILAALGEELAPDTPTPPANVGSDPWAGGPFDDMDLVTDRDSDLIIDLFDNCPSVSNPDQKDESHNSNGAEGYTSKDSIGDACGLVADTEGGTDKVLDDGKCDQNAPPDTDDNTPCSLSSAIEDGGVSGRIVFMNGGIHASGTDSHPLPRIETPLIIDGTATPLTNVNISAGPIGSVKLPAVSLPQPRCMAMLGHPCVTLVGDLKFFEAHGAEVTGVHLSYEDYGLEFERTVGARVYGNWIGSVDDGGAFGGPGLVLRESAVQVGGPHHWEQNVVSGNEDGIQVLYNGVQPNVIENNLIGTDATGKEKIGNTGEGISVTSSGPVIRNNVIAGGDHNGIAIGLPSVNGDGDDVGAVIQGNRIGMNVADKPVGNAEWGVRIDDSSGHLVGGTKADEGNQIAHNRLGGIQLQAGLRNGFTRNEIWDNGSDESPGALGINLAEDHLDEDVPTRNDAQDVDGEPGPPFGVSNTLQNFPTVISVEKEDDKTRVNVALESRPSATYRLEFFASSGCEPQRHGEGERFLVAKTLTTSTNGAGGTSFTLPEVLAKTDYVTATATNPAGETSEFSPARSRQGPCTAKFVVGSAADTDDGDVSDGRCDTGTAWEGYTGVCTLRAAITQANWLVGRDTIAFGLGNGPATITPASMLPEITDSLTIDGTTQPGFGGKPIIRLDGVTGGPEGLQIVGGVGSTVRGLSLTGWSDRALTAMNAPQTRVVGNYVGLRPDGSAAGNGGGVYMTESPRSVIGGTDAADRNVISDNGYGIWLFGQTGNEDIHIEGNRVGTNPAGTAAAPNDGVGITVGSDEVLVGGTGAAGNLVSGNATDGIRISAAVDLLGNKIGTNAAGGGQIPNGDDGIQLATVGGAAIGAPSGGGNTIAFNGGSGIEGWSGSPIRRNSISNNTQSGIDLTSSGAPLLPAPTIRSVRRTGVVKGTVAGSPGTYAVDLFLNPGPCNASVEARKFKKALSVSIPAGKSSAPFQTNVGALRGQLSFTATETFLSGPGGTSPISACRAPG